jgi:hypothetical protein
VFRVAAVYGAIAFAVMQAADFLVPALRLPEAVAAGIALVAIPGFPIALARRRKWDLVCQFDKGSKRGFVGMTELTERRGYFRCS